VARRAFGYIRRLPSGKWHASYLGPDGARRNAPNTFSSKTDADLWLAKTRSELVENRWRDPADGSQPFDDYAVSWIDERRSLRPRTADLYRWLNAKYLRPTFGRMPLRDVTAARVRTWRSELLAQGVSVSMCAKAYRLLRAILNTAVDDEILDRNPCRIRGAGDEHPEERPVLEIEQVLALSERVPTRFRVLVLVTTFASLRWGEVSALQRRDIDIAHGTVTVRSAFVERSDGTIEIGPPKSRAGRRTVVLPGFVLTAVVDHLDAIGPEATALLFTGPSGRPMRRSNFNKAIDWHASVAAIGVPQLHFHDLRHTGNTLAAGTPGTSTRDLMERMGHDSMRAALIYQHATRDADRRIADALDDQLQGHAARVIARRSHAGQVADLAAKRQDGKAAGQALERATRIELALSAWEADVLPLNYARKAR
jgi:integrase